MARTTDPRTRTFDPIPLCPADRHPIVRSAGRYPPSNAADTFTFYASASVEIAYTDSPVSQPPTLDTRSIFPFSTFGFASPIIGQQNRGYVLHGGRFAATPAASEVSTPADGALVHYSYQDPQQYASAVQNLQHFGFSPSDYVMDDSSKELYVRLRPITPERWSKVASIGGSTQQVYRFIKDCSPFKSYAHAVALNRSRNLAQAAADVMHVRVGALVVETDYAGASTNATCGSDSSGDLSALIALAKTNGQYSYGDPFYAYFWDSKYAAWALGPHAPAIASRAVVDRLSVVLKSDTPSQDITGTATINPDAYFYTDRTTSDFTTTVVASKADAPKSEAVGNVVTDCDRAQERALANAVRVAQFDGPVRSFYAAPARFLSIACFPDAAIGQSYSSFPTVYNDSSPTGAAQVTETITVYP